jgi:hypothetical protein
MENWKLIRRIAFFALATVAVTVLWTNWATADPKMTDRVFIHRFSEVASDRAGYRKYVGVTPRATITGTLLGVYDDDHVPPGAVGGVAIGHTVFFYAKDFVFATKPGVSSFYAPSTLRLPGELLK